MSDLARAEKDRLAQQVALDAQRNALERNIMGQFATPPALADQIVHYALSIHDDDPIHFLEPSMGSGAFFSSLLRHTGKRPISSATGVELDKRFADLAREMWTEYGLTVRQGDFTTDAQPEPASVSLLIANPPYVRHHHLTGEAKQVLGERVRAELGMTASGLSGLYVYFMLLAHRSLKPGAVSAWLIPSEFMDVNYGRVLKEYLTKMVTIRKIHRFEASDVQFDDALVTSAVVVFENTPPSRTHLAEFTYGGDVENPRLRVLVEHQALKSTAKWSRYFTDRAHEPAHVGPVMADYIKVRRGIATGSNGFFVMPLEEADERGFSRDNLKPILPSPRHVKEDVIIGDDAGWPIMERRLAVIDTPTPLRLLRSTDPSLAKYLDTASEKVRSGYLVKQRDLWYRQEQRPPAPFLCTYMGRGVDEDHPFRFILNLSDAVATNMFLMLYPTPLLMRFIIGRDNALHEIHAALQAISADDLRAGGRVYGGGLHKMEPKEFAAMSAQHIVALAPDLLRPEEQQSLPLLAEPA